MSDPNSLSGSISVLRFYPGNPGLVQVLRARMSDLNSLSGAISVLESCPLEALVTARPGSASSEHMLARSDAVFLSAVVSHMCFPQAAHPVNTC